jgi:NAD+ kinase
MTTQRHPRVLGLVVHPRNDVSGSVATVVELAAHHGARVIARQADASRLGDGVEAVGDDEFIDEADFLFSFGGDGTMLGAMRLVVGRGTPVLGVNHGQLGFLVEVSKAQLPRALARLMAGEFSLEPHSCLELILDGADQVPDVAFNDVVLTADMPWTTVTLDLKINDVRHGYYRCDAVVACTSSGSTAYNYAAGGPIISPSVPLIGLTPVAPMSGIGRAIVLGGDEAINLRSPDGSAATRISLDGAITRVAGPGVGATLRLRSSAANVVRFDRDAHEQRSRIKLSLLDLPLRPDQLIELVPKHLREAAASATEEL